MMKMSPVEVFLVLAILTDVALAANGTIGILVYVNPVSGSFGLNRGKLIFQQLATSILLAVQHINTRNDSIVGQSTLQLLPPDFQMRYKIADTNSQQTGAVKALLNWRCEEGSKDYDCKSIPGNIDVSGTTLPFQADPAEKIHAIIGPFRGEESVAVSNLASALGMHGFPITSYASGISELSDKIRFPFFSRTCPSLSTAALGITKVIQQFGWQRCALIYIDDPWGNSIATDFLYHTGVTNILVLSSVKFTDGSATSVSAAVDAVRASGARVVVFIEDTGKNLEALLLAADRAGIAGRDGYAWLTFEQNDPEAQLALAKTPAAILRPLLYGWLNIFGYSPSADRLARFRSIFASSDPGPLHHPLVDMPLTGFSAAGFTAFHLYAYDSAWAAAIGLAAAAPDRSDLVGRIRSASFLGASGPVSMDNVTGDRLTAGLQLRLNSVGIDPAVWPAAAEIDSWADGRGGVNWTTNRLSSRQVGGLLVL
jgi:hypothetical protein